MKLFTATFKLIRYRESDKLHKTYSSSKKFRIVKAKDEDEARRKLEKHYDDYGKDLTVKFKVEDVDFESIIE
jgi:hypothetical protein